MEMGGTHRAGFMGAPQPDLEPWKGWKVKRVSPPDYTYASRGDGRTPLKWE